MRVRIKPGRIGLRMSGHGLLLSGNIIKSVKARLWRKTGTELA